MRPLAESMFTRRTELAESFSNFQSLGSRLALQGNYFPVSTPVVLSSPISCSTSQAPGRRGHSQRQVPVSCLRSNSSLVLSFGLTFDAELAPAIEDVGSWLRKLSMPAAELML